MRRFGWLVAVLLAAPAAAADPLDGFDDAVERGLKAHGAPGVAIAVVKDGKVVLLKGYGVRTVGQSDPVTQKSLFAIGSVSKSFTAAALGILVDEKEVTWDDRLARWLPDFRLPNPYLTQETTLRDVLSHRVGIERNELIWYGSPADRGAVLKKLRDVEPGEAFRTKFVYNNILYLAAGQVVPQAAKGKSWDDFVAEKLFKPLGMTTANTSISKLPKDGDVATPHEKVKGVARPVDWLKADNIGPAGSINASAADMAEYVKFQLAGGKAGDKRVLKRDTVKEMHTPQMLMGGGGLFNPDALGHAYGLGWMLSDFKGKRLVEHGGNIDGMSAQVGMLPDENLGVVVLANLGGSLLPQALMFDLFDRYLGDIKAKRAEVTGLLAWVNDYGIKKVVEPDPSGRVKDTKPTLPPVRYAGKYQDKLHSPLTVKAEKEKLTAAFNGWTFDLEHWHYDTFKAVDKKGVLPGLLLNFPIGADGKVSEVRFKLFLGDEITLERK
jgi:CubicO group peptidase (beta-lactamase class C family)